MINIKQNPFRILGLPITATTKETVKRISELTIYSKMGKAINYDTDYNFFGFFERTPNIIEDASNQIEQAENKLFNSFFWFWYNNENTVDKIVLNILKEGNTEKAIKLWETGVSSSLINDKNYSNIKNLSILYLGLSKNGSLNKEFLKKGLKLSGEFFNSNQIIKYSKIIAGDNYIFDRNKASKFYADQIYNSLKSYFNNDINIKEFIEYFNYFPSSTKQYILLKFISGPIQNIEGEIEKTIYSRKNNVSNADKYGENLISSTKSDINFLFKILGVKNIQYQIIADKLSQEIVQCGIEFYNYTKDDGNYLEQYKYAVDIAVSNDVKERANENLKSCEKLICDKKKVVQLDDSIKYIIDKLEEVNSLNYPNIYIAKNLIYNCKNKLFKIKSVLGEGDEIYLDISSRVAGAALKIVIDTVNQDQEDFKSDHNIKDLKNGLADAISVIDEIGELDMVTELKSNFNINKKTIKESYDIVQRIPAKKTVSRVSSSGGCYIATMVYGDYNSPEVLVLRKFRDEILYNYYLGRLFIKFYYKRSPKFVEKHKNSKNINKSIKFILDNFIKILKK